MTEHTTFIFWPNGMGETPCSQEYADKIAERDRIYQAGNTDGETLDDLSPEDYQRWNELDQEIGSMQLNGHVGRGLRY